LVGDIIDGWKVKQNKLRWANSHTTVVRHILAKANREKTQVIYVAGNHDEFLRPLISYGLKFGRIEVVNQCEYLDLRGRRWLVTHGDMFDGITRLAPWLAWLGDSAYDFVLGLNTNFNQLRHRLGFGYWSLSQWLKHKVKRATNFIWQFEETITKYAQKRNFNGVICGHIHQAEIKVVSGVGYMNSGDWVESCTALVETMDGRWEIIRYKHENNLSSNRQCPTTN
jgi:UDP-2,3-diacylglucosamine pyrophosphatase LpxH